MIFNVIFNATQHQPSSDQVKLGVTEPDNVVKELITFSDIPTKEDMINRANKIAKHIKSLGYTKAMIGGAPYFMRHLEDALLDLGIEVLYAFSDRISVDVPQPDGSIKKTFTFKHKGFYKIN